MKYNMWSEKNYIDETTVQNTLPLSVPYFLLTGHIKLLSLIHILYNVFLHTVILFQDESIKNVSFLAELKAEKCILRQN